MLAFYIYALLTVVILQDHPSILLLLLTKVSEVFHFKLCLTCVLVGRRKRKGQKEVGQGIVTETPVPAAAIGQWGRERGGSEGRTHILVAIPRAFPHIYW